MTFTQAVNSGRSFKRQSMAVFMRRSTLNPQEILYGDRSAYTLNLNDVLAEDWVVTDVTQPISAADVRKALASARLEITDETFEAQVLINLGFK